MSIEEPNIIYGCGRSCVFRFPNIGGMATNGGCKCVRYNMTPDDAVKLQKKIRDLVNYAAILRMEHKKRQESLFPEKRDPHEIILGC